jgi:hypothetical protein
MGLLALKRGLRLKVFERWFQERACNSGQDIAMAFHSVSVRHFVVVNQEHAIVKYHHYSPLHLLCIFSSLQVCFQLQTWSMRVWDKKFSLAPSTMMVNSHPISCV